MNIRPQPQSIFDFPDTDAFDFLNYIHKRSYRNFDVNRGIEIGRTDLVKEYVNKDGLYLDDIALLLNVILEKINKKVESYSHLNTAQRLGILNDISFLEETKYNLDRLNQYIWRLTNGEAISSGEKRIFFHLLWNFFFHQTTLDDLNRHLPKSKSQFYIHLGMTKENRDRLNQERRRRLNKQRQNTQHLQLD